MINLFGSPAGRAINEITSIKLKRSEHDASATRPMATPIPISHKSSAMRDKQKPAIRSDFTQLNLTKFNQSTNANKTDIATNSNLLAKKIKFWKYFEENKRNNNNSHAFNNNNNNHSNNNNVSGADNSMTTTVLAKCTAGSISSSSGSSETRK